MKRFIGAGTIGLSLLATVTLAAAQERQQYLCVADSAVGFRYDKGSWSPEILSAAKERWIVHSGGLGGAPYGVKQVGGIDVDSYTCRGGSVAAGDIECRIEATHPSL